MNIFKTYVKRNLRNNRLRTTMTIMGIILSVALVAAVIEGAFSGVEYIRNVLKDTYGDHHGYALNMTIDIAYELTGKDEIDGCTGFNTAGWAEIGSQNSTKPYLLVKEASEDIKEFLSIKILEGRFPENENEILLPIHLVTNGNVQYKIGDKLTLDLSERYMEKSDAKSDNDNNYDITDSINSEGEENIINGFIPETTKYIKGERLLSEEDGFDVLTKEYIVCGFMERLPYTVEQYMCPGYTAIVKSTGLEPKTYNGYEIPSYNVFFRVKDPVTYNEFHDTFEKEHPSVMIVKNREYVAMYGGINSRSITFFIGGFVTVLIALILFGSISLVYNSFSISINERTKQIGILKSEGATKKQIRKTIFYEALFDCIISIPLGIILGCAGIGITLFLLQEGFTKFLGYFGGYSSENVKIELVLNVPLIIAAILIVVIAVFLSAAIPAFRASNISPIDLVRQNADIKASGKIRKSRILTRLFGAEGMLASKNYSRNKKRYRSTIVSLSVSIILFIAASSFCSYLNSATESEVYTGNVDLIYYTVDDYSDVENQTEDYHEIKEMLLSAQDVNSVIVTNNLFDYILYDPDRSGKTEMFENNTAFIEVNDESDITGSSEVPVSKNEKISTSLEDEEGGYYDEPAAEAVFENNASVYFIDDESFFSLLKSEEIDVPEQSEMTWNAVVYNKGSIYTFYEDDNRKKVEYKFIEEEDLPKKLGIKWYNEYGSSEISPVDSLVDGEGEVYVAFLDSSLVLDYYNILENEVGWRLAQKALYEEFNQYLESIGKDTDNLIINQLDAVSGELDDEKKDVNDSVRPLSEEELDIIGKCTFKKREDLSYKYDLNIIGVTYNDDYAMSTDAIILLPFSAMPENIEKTLMKPEYYIFSNNSKNSEEAITKLLLEQNMDTAGLYNVDTANVGKKMIGRIVSVFSYGFILLISLVAIANVFNTISTNVRLRRREFGMLKSMGLSNKGVSKILNIECLIYGSWSLLIGLPLSIPFTWCIYKITNRAFSVSFMIPWYSVAIAVAAVFLVVFITMVYASGKIKKDNTLDAIRAENI